MDLEAILQQLMSLINGGGGGPTSGTTASGAPFQTAGMSANVPPGGASPSGGGLNLQTILSLLTALGGGVYGMQELKDKQRLYEEQRANAALAMNPSALAKRTEAATIPLNRQLTYAISKPVESEIARSGMAQAPGATASALGSAIAPFAQQNQQLGAQMAEFGFPYVQNLQSPDYLRVLEQLNQFGRGSTFSAPSGTPGMGP
jgi:hypothetical protein